MFNAALSFSGKAVSGAGTVLGGVILTAIAFPTQAKPADVPPDAIVRLGIVVGMLVPLFYLIPISLITRYRITRARHAEIQAALKAR
jgi:Na+/melibiose symporter-like transporter